jgi:hypothetical protein
MGITLSRIVKDKHPTQRLEVIVKGWRIINMHSNALILAVLSSISKFNYHTRQTIILHTHITCLLVPASALLFLTSSCFPCHAKEGYHQGEYIIYFECTEKEIGSEMFVDCHDASKIGSFSLLEALWKASIF